MTLRRWIVPFAAVLLAPGAAAPQLALDPPVITATYETARGTEEEDKAELQPDYVRHTVLVSARQEFGERARLTSGLQATISGRLSAGSQLRCRVDSRYQPPAFRPSWDVHSASAAAIWPATSGSSNIETWPPWTARIRLPLEVRKRTSSSVSRPTIMSSIPYT